MLIHKHEEVEPSEAREKIKEAAAEGSWYWLVQDMLVDIFGKLVPGVVFVFVAAVSITFSVDVILRTGPLVMHEEFARHVPVVAKFLNSIWGGALITALFTAYVAGQLLYRLDIKKPDEKSVKLINKKRGKKTQVENKNDLACEDLDRCEFPYPNLGDYLQRRGFYHLCRFVHWGPTLERRRSRQYVNILKTRIRLTNRNMAHFLDRLEADVRLMNTTWHGARVLMWVAGIGLATSVTALMLQYSGNPKNDAMVFGFAPALMANILILTIAFLAKRAVIGFFHPLRIRELVFILETANYIKDNSEFPSLFADLISADPSQIASIQLALQKKGLPIKVDGIYTPDTRMALLHELMGSLVFLDLEKESSDKEHPFITQATAEKVLQELKK